MKPLKVLAILQDAGATDEVIQKAMHLLAVKKNVPGADWKRLLHTLAVDRRKVASNRGKWAVDTVSTYEKYLEIMDRVKRKVESAMLTYPAIADAKREAQEKNRLLGQQGKWPGPSCGERWQTWVPPAVRQEMTKEFEKVYLQRALANGTGGVKGMGKGRRMVPFMSLQEREMLEKNRLRLVRTFNHIRSVHATPNTRVAPTPYRALHLLACREAEIELERRVAGYKNYTIDPFDCPLPVNWKALLPPDTRTRLREADKNPAGVSTARLGAYLMLASEETMTDDELVANDAELARKAGHAALDDELLEGGVDASDGTDEDTPPQPPVQQETGPDTRAFLRELGVPDYE